MATATIDSIDTSQLSTEETNALTILKNLTVEQVSQLKQLLKLDKPDLIDGATLTALAQLCSKSGFPLTLEGVNAFKDLHHLGNSGAFQGVIGGQTAGVYFEELLEAVASKPAATAPKGNLNPAIVAAAKELRGMSTADGPDGGNNACAWSVNRVLKKAGIPPLGENPNFVPSLLEALQNGRGQQVEPAASIAGDLVVAYGEAHIGIALDDGCQTVLSNSSSKACFRWESDLDYMGVYGGSSTVYRLLK